MSLTAILSTAFKPASRYYEKRDGGSEMAKEVAKGDGEKRGEVDGNELWRKFYGKLVMTNDKGVITNR